MRAHGWASAVAAASALPGLFLAALVLPTGLAAGAERKATTAQHSSASKLHAVGNVKFWECPSKTTKMLVALNTLTLHPGSRLTITFIVRNTGTRSCNYTAPYAGIAPGPTTATLEAGPCGSIGYEMTTSHGHEVWPGPQLVNCPALGFAQLAPGATVSGTGTWNQDEPNTDRRVTPGRYTVIVDNKTFSFPIVVSSS